MNDILVQWWGGGDVNDPKSANYYVFRYFLQVILENNCFDSVVFLELLRQCGIFRIVSTVCYF
jgi:hypothetical protein